MESKLPPQPIPLDEFIKTLGPMAEGKTDVEIEKIRDMQDRFADVFFDRWMAKKNKKTDFPATENGGKI